MTNSSNSKMSDNLILLENENVFERIEFFIGQGIKRQILSVPWLASQIELSERQLLRLIKKRYRITTNKYINNIKLNLAKSELSIDNQIAIKDLSAKLMYSDVKYFSRLFKIKFSCNPSEFKRESESDAGLITFDKTSLRAEAS